MIRPAIMDSHGKPGMAGNTIGVDVELVDVLVVVVGVLTTVTVDNDVLITVVVNELVVVIGIVALLVAVALELTLDTVVVTGVELVVVDVVEFVPPLVTVGGTTGSR
jgi:hypothetical protein